MLLIISRTTKTLELFIDVIKNFGAENVIQIVTYTNFVFVRMEKMSKYKMFWTPCVAHCIDLMFEDIGKRKCCKCHKKARNLTNYILIMIDCLQRCEI